MLAVATASEPWVCKLMNARREEYLRQKKEKRIKKSSNTLKEISIRVRWEGGRNR
jgi:translation initiation factor IF-3